MSALIIIVIECMALANWFKGVHQALKTHVQQTMLRPCYCSSENNRGVAEAVRLWTAGISGDGLRKLPHNSGLDRGPPDRARNIDMGTDHCLDDKHEARGASMTTATCQILESGIQTVSHCMHENIHSTGGSGKINMQTNCITHSSALSSQLFWAWSSRTDHSAFLTF